ncbi:MAG: hypothetical protein JJU00_09690 [Opitutales bacterium]|nr:hypothetical protein [Opitutales bacterium]
MPAPLPALLFATEFLKQAKKRGLEIDGGRKRVQLPVNPEELTEEVASARLFELAAACRSAGIDPESALRRHVRKQMEQADNAQKRRETL